MNGPLFYDREVQPISIERFEELVMRDDYKRVAEETIEQVWVSTVWLGIDYDFTRMGPPLIFETMIFNSSWEGQDCWRWPTEAAALAGHDQAVEWVRFKLAHDFEPAPERQW